MRYTNQFCTGEYIRVNAQGAHNSDSPAISIVSGRDVQEDVWWPNPAAAVRSAET